MTGESAARSPLAAEADALAAIGAREIAFLAQVSVRAFDGAAAGLPSAPNTWVEADRRESLWLGPDEWLVVGPPGSSASIISVLEAGGASAVVDVSANRAVIDLVDERRVGLLEQGCGLDLDPRVWRDGMCAQTLLARIPVLLQERREATRIYLRPSFGGYLIGWLARAAASEGVH